MEGRRCLQVGNNLVLIGSVHVYAIYMGKRRCSHVGPGPLRVWGAGEKCLYVCIERVLIASVYTGGGFTWGGKLQQGR